MGGRRAWRLLRDDPEDGAWNMSVDEALLVSHGARAAPAPVTLRLYAWSLPTLSLGTRQACPAACEPGRLRAAGIEMIRRPSGGGAVLHARERTYCVSAATSREPFPGGVLDTYRRIAAALASALRALGVAATAVEPQATRSSSARTASTAQRDSTPSCFERFAAHEIAAGGRKLVGSAQLRRGGAFLQHGSLPLTSPAGLLERALGRAVDADRFTDLAAVAGTGVETSAVDAALVAAFEERFDCRLEAGALTPAEREHATRLYAWKYSSLAWTLGARVGERERRWGPSF